MYDKSGKIKERKITSPISKNFFKNWLWVGRRERPARTPIFYIRSFFCLLLGLPKPANGYTFEFHMNAGESISGDFVLMLNFDPKRDWVSPAVWYIPPEG